MIDQTPSDVILAKNIPSAKQSAENKIGRKLKSLIIGKFCKAKFYTLLTQ